MESAINELMTEFREQWDNEVVDFAALIIPIDRVHSFIMRAYEIGKMVEKNNKKEVTK